MAMSTTEHLFENMTIPIRLDEFNKFLDHFFVIVDNPTRSEEDEKRARIMSIMLQFVYNYYVYEKYNNVQLENVSLTNIEADYEILIEKICAFLKVDLNEMNNILSYYKLYSQTEENKGLLCYQSLYQFFNLEELRNYGI